MNARQNRPTTFQTFLILVPFLLAIGAAWIVASGYQNPTEAGRLRFRKNVEDLRAGATHLLSLTGIREADTLLEEIRGIPEIEKVSIDQSRISIVGMRHLGTLPNLKTVEAYYSHHHTGISDEGILELRNCKKLRTLFIFGGLTEEGIAEISRQMPDVRVITEHK